jgi:regulator of sigma E protease
VRRTEGGSAEFIEVPVYARWSADPYTYRTELEDAIDANAQPPITVKVASTEGFDNSSVLVIDEGTPAEERFEYCVDNASTLILMERGLDETPLSAHAAGAPVITKVSQGPTGITIGPAYTNPVRLTEEERRELEEQRTPCDDDVPAIVGVPISETRRDGPATAVVDGSKRAWESVVLARNEIISRIRGGVGGSGGFQVTGPVGIAQLTGEVVEEAGWKSLMELAGLISMNLAILNILPLPMLDGGRVTFVLIEYLRGGRRVAPEREAMVHFVGMVVMLALAAVITFFDISRIWQGEGIIR